MTAESTGVRTLLASSRFELVPIRGAEEEAWYLPPGATVPVTSSPRKGIEATVSLVERLAGQGFRAVPHLSARLLRSPSHLREVVDRLAEAGVDDVFVVGGDATEPAGPYESAAHMLRDMAALDHRFRAVGIAGYPERHPFVEREELDRALLQKEPLATYLVTQICFDPEAIFGWLAGIRRLGIGLPVYLGVPGAVKRRKLLEIALRIGVGESLRYLTKHGNLVARLMGRGSFRPDSLLARIHPYLSDPGHGLRGLHINTFNQVRTTERWRQRALADYRWAGRDAAGGPDETGFAS